MKQPRLTLDEQNALRIVQKAAKSGATRVFVPPRLAAGLAEAGFVTIEIGESGLGESIVRLTDDGASYELNEKKLRRLYPWA